MSPEEWPQARYLGYHLFVRYRNDSYSALFEGNREFGLIEIDDLQVRPVKPPGPVIRPSDYGCETPDHYEKKEPRTIF